MAYHSTLVTPRPARWTGLTTWERRGLYGLLLAAVLFGGLVEFRSAFLQRRMGDLEVFLRTAWAVRAGEDIYVITDSKGFHYHYPPLFAIAMTPLADAPPGAERSWMLPYGVSVLVWYLFNLGCLAVSVHWLAGALERGQPTARFSRRWWALRIIPVLACLPAIGGSLMRGQVDLLLLLLLTGMIIAALRGQSMRAGFWLAGAICLKVIPAFLLIYPCWRRDGRWLAGCAVGLFVGLLLIPACVFGPRQTLPYYEEWRDVLVKPALVEGGDQSRAKELIDVTATDSQSFLAIIHNTLHLDRSARPAQASAAVRLAHWSLGGLLTLLTLLAARRRLQPGSLENLSLLGALMVLMVLLSPVCHLHYFALSVPLALCLVAASWQSNTIGGDGVEIGTGLKALFAFNIVANVLPRLPGMEFFRDTGIAAYAALLIWGTACVVLSRKRPPAAHRALAQAA